MKLIFEKHRFPSAPGGNFYEWKDVETVFEVSHDGLFAVKIQASCKNAKQNRSNDDDDLRIAMDSFNFGKYEQNEQGSWKGFNTSASWNGATLMGGTKTIYYFVNLNKGQHNLQFFADERPILKSVEVFEIKNCLFELSNLKPPDKIKSDNRGIPWLGFIFLGFPSKSLAMGVRTRSSKRKGGTDGDNLKVVINGKTHNNPQALTSDKYKNFYFSGDLKEFDMLTITDERLATPSAFENAVELWYDEEPEITSLKIDFFHDKALLNYLRSFDLDTLRKQILLWAYFGIAAFSIQGKKYSADFLKNAIKEKPETLVFKSNAPIVAKIKKDPVYKKIVSKIKEKINAGNLNGEIRPDDFKHNAGMEVGVNFNSKDLSTSLHGICKIQYEAIPLKGGRHQLEMVILDIYDFHQIKEIPFFLLHPMRFLTNFLNNQMNAGEELNVIHNFEIKIHITDIIYVA